MTPTSATAEDSSLAVLGTTLLEAGFSVFPADASDRPGLLVLDPARGLAVIDQCGGESAADPLESLKLLNRKVSQLLNELPSVGELPVHRFVVVDEDPSSRGNFYLGKQEMRDLRWLTDIPSEVVPSDLLESVRAQLTPAASFTMKARARLEDPGRADRETYRVRLDAAQAETAFREVDDVLVVDGPAGSGKSLVLAARARWLAEKHPDWSVQVLCYNKALVPYLRSLVADFDNVDVSTFGRFVSRLNHRTSFKSEAEASGYLDQARKLGIPEVVDALLIDEWQDFFPAWTKYALATLRSGRGGAVLVGDEQQAIYRDALPTAGLVGRSVEQANLKRPYRSTRQIIEVVQSLDPDFQISGGEQAPEGEPVELIWAESVMEQARAVADDLLRLAQAGRPWSDMAVLMTRKSMIRTVLRAMYEREVPFELISTKSAGDLDLSSDTVKIMTVHSAKGLEFSIVALIGLENLKDQRASDADETEQKELSRFARVGFVGPTRAADTLLLTYSKDNVFLDRLRSSDAPYRAWTWPDDYEGVE